MGSIDYAPEMNKIALDDWRHARFVDLLNERFGGNAEALGRALGYSNGGFVRHMRDGRQTVTEGTVLRIQQRIPGCSEWFSPPLTTEDGPSSQKRVINDTLQTDTTERLPSVGANQAVSLVHPRLIPLRGEIAGGKGSFVEDLQYQDVQSGIDFPTDDPLAYALKVRGDQWHPRYRAGEFLVITRSHKPEPGEDVLATLTDGRKILAELNWIRGDDVQLLLFSGQPVTLPRSQIELIELVGGRASRRSQR